MWSIFKTFFFLGWVCFGGPAAHIGYFRSAFVTQRKWLDDQEYAQLVALSQFLPGPGSSQVGFAIGYKRAGIPGAMAAFAGFTLPSVILMLLLAMISKTLLDTSFFQAVIHSLKLLAVVVVADAAWGMYKSFCTRKLTTGLCIATAASVLVMPSVATQIFLLALAALIGTSFLSDASSQENTPFTPALAPLISFILLLFGLPLLASAGSYLAVFGEFFQVGSLVFGGGHVVLPLLQEWVGSRVTEDVFLTAYAAAQAVPGPMFTLATFIGYEITNQSIIGALVATLGIFLPGFLLLLVVLKNWQSLANQPNVAGAMKGVNAAVVGLLLAALYQPVFSSAVVSPADMAVILVGFYVYKRLHWSILRTILYFLVVGLLL